MITNLILTFSGLLGFITLFFILISFKSNRLINVYLALVIFFVSLRFCLIGLKDFDSSTLLNEIVRYYNISFIFLIPVTYLYFKNLILSIKNFAFKDLFHFLLPILFILSIRNLDSTIVFGIQLHYIFVSVFIIYTITYSILIYFMLKRNVWNKKGSLEIVIKQNALITKWTIYLYTVINLMILRFLLSLYFELKSDSLISGLNGLWITAIIWIFIYAKILTSPEILYGYAIIYKKENPNENSASPTISTWSREEKNKITNVQDVQLKSKLNQNIGKYIVTLEDAVQQNHFFRDSKFSLLDLALKLNIPKSHLSYLFKYHSVISFSDYKKIIRIQDALQLIQEDYLKSNTFDSLAKEVGFASYNPFFTSFKDVVGKTPNEYCITIEI
jgi:AraC-like DNA-binding protein